MRVKVKWDDFHCDSELTKVMIEAKRLIEKSSFNESELGGGSFRSKLIQILKSEFRNQKFLLFDENTVLIVQVSHPGGAFSKLLEILLAYKQGEIKRCIFVTQTYDLAVRRNKIKNPNSTRDGNRIYFETAVNTIETYAESFLDIPIGILGIDFRE
jgi:hypothetical protein